MFKKKKSNNDNEMKICEGIEISKAIYERKENRLLTLIIKGFIIYFITAGGVCGLLSAAGTTYSPLLINFVLFIVSMYISCIHYSKKLEDRGNIAFLIILVICGFGLSIYINSGFYSVLNDINESAKEYFNYTGIRTYAEPINNRVLAVNLAAISLGIISVFLINMWIKRMMYLDAMLLAVLMIIYPCYIEREPDLIYVMMILCGGGLAYVYNKSRHYYNEQTDSILKMGGGKKRKKKKKSKVKEISYSHNYKAFASVGAIIIIVTLTFTLIMQVVMPKSTFHEKNTTTDLKTRTKEHVGTFIRQGFAGFFSLYENVAGLSDGRVGGVGLVNLDYNTDFTLTYTPYSQDTVYLKEKEFVEYVPYENEWKEPYTNIEINVEDYNANSDNEGKTLRDAYLNNGDEEVFVSKGKMKITNIGLLSTYFRPYYICNDEKVKTVDTADESSVEFNYYPRLDKTDVKIENQIDLSPFLRYSADNEEALANFCKKAGVNEKMEPDKIVAKIATYYQKKYPYTLNPGITPMKKDFVNYFLEEHNKGYCVHFATAATLALRYLGIPAKYVQGYAIQYDDILRGTLLQDEKYEDYYEGYNELGETGVVEVEVTDASAHAWVEIYDEKSGWKPVEVTPSAVNEDTGGGGGFWNNFMGIFAGNNNTNKNKNSNNKSNNPNRNDNKDIFTSDIVRNIVIMALIIGFIVVLVLCIRLALYRTKYNKANINDRLIMDYSKYLKKRTRKNIALKEKVNYRQQIEFLYLEHLFKISVEENIVDDIIKILETAGFSNKYITEEENNLIRSILGI